MSVESVPLPQMESTVLKEARKTERIAVLRPVQVKTSDGWEFTAVCTDVNLSGIGIDSDRVLRVGQRVQVEVATHVGESMPVNMLVIYRMGRHYGLTALNALEQLLELLPVNA
ncbi:MAG TPA: PilZ domain-containing protein [Terriglobales bacterium]|nr:PilZ domain-containing protein [Terriglobales bacterium]